MIEDDSAKCVIHAVINVIARLSVTHRFADDAGHGAGCRGDQESPRLGQDLDIFWKQPRDLPVDLLRERAEWLYMLVVRRGKAAADVQYLDFVAARFGFPHHRCGHVHRLDEVLKICALAAHMETQSLDDQTQLECPDDEIHRFARVAAELGGELDH